jgi:hypothetical protein
VITDESLPLAGADHLGLTRLVRVAAAWLLAALVLREALQFANGHLVAFDFAYYWPISVFQPRVPDVRVLARAASVAVLFAVALRLVAASGYRTPAIVGAGMALLIAGNSIQGWADGIAAPIAYDARSGVFVPVSADGEQYYHDALRVADPAAFLRTYEAQQPTLHQHTRTHPPGPVLLLYALNRALGNPALIAIALTALSLTLSTIWLSRLLAAHWPWPVAGYVSFLFVLLPAVHIYYLATVDALVAALVIGVVQACQRPGRITLLAAALLTTAALFLTFAALFLLPLRRRTGAAARAPGQAIGRSGRVRRWRLSPPVSRIRVQLALELRHRLTGREPGGLPPARGPRELRVHALRRYCRDSGVPRAVRCVGAWLGSENRAYVARRR